MTEDAVRDTYRKSREARAKLKATLENSGKLLERSVLSLVILGGYFALTLFSTNDAGIMDLERSAQLPVFGVNVPLMGLFVVAPLLLAAKHFHVLFVQNQHLKHLLDYTDGCSEQELDLLPDSMMNTLPKIGGYRYLGVLFSQWMLLVCLPVALQVVIQYRASVFRHLPVTAAHFLVVLFELVLVRLMWHAPCPSRYRRGPEGRFGRNLARVLRGEKKTVSLLLTVLALCSLLNLSGLVVQQHFYQVVYHSPIDHTARLFVDKVNLMRRKILTGPLEARLGEPETDMRGRDLGFADFRGSDLGGIDLSGGSLRGAVLQGTSLRRAVLVDLDAFGADLRGADLYLADLTGADLRHADLTGADLTGADLHEADLAGAKLTAAVLNGADFTDAGLRGALMDHTQAVVALFTGADMAGASLRQCMAPCASFSSANLAGADLQFASCQAGNFMGADLTDASFLFARLQGAYLGFVTLLNTNLSGIEANGLVLHPLPNDPPTATACLLDPPPSLQARLSRQAVWARLADSLPEQAGRRSPRTMFQMMLEAAERRADNQTPVRFDDLVSSADQAPTRVATDTRDTVRLLTVDLPQIMEPLRRRARDFQSLNPRVSIQVEVQPIASFPETIRARLAADPASFDGLVAMPALIGELAAQGYLEDVSACAVADTTLDFHQILPVYRHVNACFEDAGGCKRVFAVPLDGDMHLMYYRADLIAPEEVPRTWDAYLALAAKLNRKGGPVVGQVLPNLAGSEAYEMFWSVAHPYLQTQGIEQGSYFDREGMVPLVDNEAFYAAVTTYLRILNQGPRDAAGRPRTDISLREAQRWFMSGKAAMTIDWSDLGTSEGFQAFPIKASVSPGSSRALNRTTNRLEKVSTASAPYALAYDGALVNHAPFAAANGWSGVIAAKAPLRTRQDLYRFFVFMSARVQSEQDVTSLYSGYNPYRTSHLFQNQAWQRAEINPTFLQTYLSALQDSLENPNLVMDLQIVDAYRILREGYEQILHPRLIAALPGSAENPRLIRSTCKELAAFMTAVVEERGIKPQARAFRATLDLDPCPCTEEPGGDTALCAKGP